MTLISAISPSPDEGTVLSKASFRAANMLGLSQKQLAETIGISTASASRMKDGGFALTGKPFELATCLIRVFRSLDAITGGDRIVMKAWMNAINTDLSGQPKLLVQSAPGLIFVMQYLDASRAPL